MLGPPEAIEMTMHPKEKVGLHSAMHKARPTSTTAATQMPQEIEQAIKVQTATADSVARPQVPADKTEAAEAAAVLVVEEAATEDHQHTEVLMTILQETSTARMTPRPDWERWS